MKIIVCIKQVPAVTEVKIDSKTGLLVREGIPSMINPMDKNSLELALKIKNEIGESEIIAISMGPPQAGEVLREALAMGVDRAYLLTDRKFAGADTLATSHTLSLAIKKLLKELDSKKFCVICGNQAIDGDTGQVGPELAEELSIPHITNVQKVEIKDNKLIVESLFRSEEIIVLEAKFPVLLAVLKDLNRPRFPKLSGIVDAFDQKEVVHWNAEDIEADEHMIGLNGSETQVWRIFIPEAKGEYIKFSGTIEEKVKTLCKYLKEDKLL